MIIKTQYGEFDSSSPIMNDKNVSKDLNNLLDAAEIFFQDEITTYDNDDLGERLFGAWARTFDEPMRVAAIQLFLDCPFTSIEKSDWGDHNYDVDGEGSFMILTDEEADKEHEEYEKNLIEDIGVRGAFSAEKVDEFLDNDDLIDNEWFRGYMEDSNYDYAKEIQYEGEDDLASTGYVNRLHEELCQNGLMEEPEWPEDQEPQKVDFKTTAEYIDAHNDWFENLESIIQKYKNEAEAKIQDYADFMSKDYDNPGEWFRDHFGDEEYKDRVDEEELWEIDAIVKYMLESGDLDRGSIASYDNVENDQFVELDGKKENFFIYQMD